jgi:hypothetical protein
MHSRRRAKKRPHKEVGGHGIGLQGIADRCMTKTGEHNDAECLEAPT